MPRDDPRMSAQTLKVLALLLADGQSEMAGAEIGQKTALQSGTLYPILMRLEDAGWLSSRWEDGDPKAMGRPRRRYYRLTGLGAQRTRMAFRDLQPTVGSLAWT